MRWCPSCAIASTHPLPSPDEQRSVHALDRYRSSDGSRFHSWVERAITRFSRAKRKRILRYRERGAILDIGCGRGLFLRSMADKGWTVLGTEIDEQVANAAATGYGIPVSSQEAFWNISPESFDVITMFHTLEHMQDPLAVIERCGVLLKKNGMLIISVPNLASMQAAWGKCDWFHLDLPAHLNHFTSRGLVALLQTHSFRPVRTRHFDAEQNVFGWFQTMLNKSRLPKNMLYRHLQLKGLRDGSARWDLHTLLAHVLLLPPCLLLSIFLALVEALLRRGGTIEVHAIYEGR